MNDALRNFGAAVGALDEELDWELLGRAYCEGDGSGFFDDDLRQEIIDSGLCFAADIGEALGNDLSSALAGSVGRSLYLGAEIAELPLILADQLVLGRRVEWLNIAGPQTSELVRALTAVSAKLSIELPLPRVRELTEIEPASCDHLWMVSVLTDPDHFPALHDALYERAGSELATGRGSLADERRRADALVEALLDCAAAQCVLSTSDEERSLIVPLVAQRGWELEFERGGRLSAIVGDKVRLGTLRRGT